MNRADWKATYRRDRATVRLVDKFKDLTGEYPSVLFTGLSPGFDICRLFGDRLNACCGHLGKTTHRNRMVDLSKRVRLPA